MDYNQRIIIAYSFGHSFKTPCWDLANYRPLNFSTTSIDIYLQKADGVFMRGFSFTKFRHGKLFNWLLVN